MHLVAQILVAVVAAIHVYILVLEMFLWRGPRGRAAFGTTPEFAESTATLAANQGLYGAATVSRRILFVQTVPAVVALVFTLLAA